MQEAFNRAVDQGYQASQTWHQGIQTTLPLERWKERLNCHCLKGTASLDGHQDVSILQGRACTIYVAPCCMPEGSCFPVAAAGSLVADHGSAPGSLQSTVTIAKWAFSVTPVDGWGSRNSKQQATAGWLSALPVFEPHWQANH